MPPALSSLPTKMTSLLRLVPKKNLMRLLVFVCITWLLFSLMYSLNGSRIVERIDDSSAQDSPLQAKIRRYYDNNDDGEQGVQARPKKRLENMKPDIVVDVVKPKQVQAEEKDNEIVADELKPVIPLPNKDLQGAFGENGRAVVIPENVSKEVQKLIDSGWADNAFNQYASDLMSLHRSLPDVRDPRCKSLPYRRNLPNTSVIITFHNEAWSTLMRTVHSILDRSPPELVKEIVLVDDKSTHDYLGKKLEQYVLKLKKVKIVRAPKRVGLIRARLLGAAASSAPVLTFLDSHCECAEGWLEPLLDRIAADPTTVVCPVIDVIDDKTFEFHYNRDAAALNVGGFDWNLQFNWHAVPERERRRHKSPVEPVWSPTMAGGLFSIDKHFFEKLGTYDNGFDIWGGENLEISFKTWMCGGTLEIVPCSHVGHVFRSRSPYKWRSGVNVLKRNSIRLAEVWLDDYKKYYYERIGDDLGDYGDISSRKALRNNLNCHSFSWFLKNIYPELFIPGEAVASGEVRNFGGSGHNMCIDSSAKHSDMHKPVGLYPCHLQGGNQYWLLSKNGEIRRDDACLDFSGRDVILYPCHGSKGNQLWSYNHEARQIKHDITGKCLELSKKKDKLLVMECDPSNAYQHWQFSKYDPSMMYAQDTSRIDE